MPTRRELANAVRALSMDAVQRANSGHPGMPMGMADIAEVLWNDFLKHDPSDPNWSDRDRFVLSNGHGSMLLYSLLHLTGYDLPMSEIRNFRQLHSRTAGHPEYGETPGVETTTGPLGQGIANGVGMALGEKVLAQRFNREGHELVDHRTWVFLGDGCLMEGISHEACSLAATLGLNKLIAFWDENGISIDGEISGWFTDDTPARFEAYGWLVIRDVDGHDPVEIRQAIETALAETQRPTLICCRTVIGFGSPAKQGSAASHGAPLGDEEVAKAREAMSWPHPPFEIPQAVYAAWDARDSGAAARQAWEARWTAYAAAYPEPAAEYDRRMRGALPTGWEAETAAAIAQLQAEAKDMATRKASQLALESFGPLLPELIGGSADLAGSNNTIWSGSKNVLEGQGEGNYVYFGVREFGMTALCNGLALHGGFIPYSATFLVFSDYARNAVRMSAMMGAHNIHIYTHDSIGLGEDGPTHQPVEHLTSLRLMPNLSVWRPCDAVESAVAWKLALEEKHQPHALIFSRQGLPAQSRSEAQLALIEQGGYILADSDGMPDVILMATGSEVQLIVEAARQLADSGIAARVVSMPNPERFLQQDAAYTESVLPAAVTSRVAVEAGSTLFWRGLVGDRGKVIGIDSFGDSAPATDLFEHYGINVLAVVDAARKSLNT